MNLHDLRRGSDGPVPRSSRLLVTAVAGVLLVGAVAVATAAGGAVSQQVSAEERQLIAVLQSDAPKAEKAISCKRLVVHGTSACTSALGPLLDDPQLVSWARIALEAIADPSAAAVLRDGAARLEGRSLVGVINSLGVLRDQEAVALLTTRLQDNDAAVVAAAAVALGRIGHPDGTDALRTTLAQVDAAGRSAAAAGCILAAEQHLAAGQSAAARELYDQVRQVDVPQQQVLEATRGAILARGADGRAMLLELLRSTNRQQFDLGLNIARELSGREVTIALVDEMLSEGAQRPELLAMVIADRDDEAALPALVRAAATRSGPVQLVAIKAIAEVGDVSCLDNLLELATAADAGVRQAALGALETLPGDDVDAELLPRFAGADAASLSALAEVAGRRGLAAANPHLVKLIQGSNDDLRAVATTALGETARLEHLGILISQATGDTGSDRAVAALRSASVRMAERDVCAKQLVSALSEANGPVRSAIIEILGSVGGETALARVAEIARSDDEQLQDVASRVLGEWMTADAGPALLSLATADVDKKYQVRALRGYLRIARQFQLPKSERAKMAQAALEVAQRDKERQLALEVLERYPCRKAFEVAIAAADEPATREAAEATLHKMLERTFEDAIDAEQTAAHLAGGQLPDVRIIQASYGTDEKQKDVTKALRSHAGGLPFAVLSGGGKYNWAFGGDPAPGEEKQLRVKFVIDGQIKSAVFAENEPVLLHRGDNSAKTSETSNGK